MKRTLLENIYSLSIKKHLMKPTVPFELFYKDCSKMSTHALMKWYKSIVTRRVWKDD